MVPGVWIKTVDCLERYLLYGGMWMVWKGAQSVDWFCG
jgi:hypothetical protein